MVTPEDNDRPTAELDARYAAIVAAQECSGGEEAHEAHMAINDECPWCGASR